MYKILFIIIYVSKFMTCLEEEPPFNITRKIIGGHKCSTELYSFMISIRTPEMLHFCGGSLIKENWVLSAAHCIFTDNPSNYILVAETSEFDKEGVQKSVAIAVFSHPKFCEATFAHDISLIEAETPFILSPQLKTIDLPKSRLDGEVKDVCSEATVIGWGHTEKWDPTKDDIHFAFDPILQCVTLPVLSKIECTRMRSGKKPKKNMICTYFEGGDKDACQGDSGGPLFCNNTQYGIVSSGYGCGLPNSPGYYARVDSYIDYINDIMSQTGPYSRYARSDARIILLPNSIKYFEYVSIGLCIAIMIHQ